MHEPRPLVSNRHPVKSLFRIAITIVLGFVIIGPAIGLIVASLFYGDNFLQNITQPDQHPEIAHAMLLLQGTVSLVGLIIVPVLFITLLERKKLKPFFPAQPNTLFVLMIISVLGISFLLAISPIGEWNMNVKFPEFMSGFENWARSEEDRLAKFTKLLTQFDSIGGLLVGILVIGLLPAVGEELVFRGMLQREVWRSTNNIHLSIWVSAIIFSAIHMQFFGFFPRMLLGALFGYLYYWSDNLLIPMFAHFFNNSFAVIMLYLFRHDLTKLDVEDTTAAPWPIVLTAMLVVGVLLFLVWKHYQDNPPEQTDSEALPRALP